jgi:hypothetical protein
MLLTQEGLAGWAKSSIPWGILLQRRTHPPDGHARNGATNCGISPGPYAELARSAMDLTRARPVASLASLSSDRFGLGARLDRQF